MGRPTAVPAAGQLRQQGRWGGKHSVRLWRSRAAVLRSNAFPLR